MTMKKVALASVEVEFSIGAGIEGSSCCFSDCITTFRNLLTDASGDGNEGYLFNIIRLVKERYETTLNEDEAFHFAKAVVEEWGVFKKKSDGGSPSPTTSE